MGFARGRRVGLLSANLKEHHLKALYRALLQQTATSHSEDDAAASLLQAALLRASFPQRQAKQLLSQFAVCGSTLVERRVSDSSGGQKLVLRLGGSGQLVETVLIRHHSSRGADVAAGPSASRRRWAVRGRAPFARRARSDCARTFRPEKSSSRCGGRCSAFVEKKRARRSSLPKTTTVLATATTIPAATTISSYHDFCATLYSWDRANPSTTGRPCTRPAAA